MNILKYLKGILYFLALFISSWTYAQTPNNDKTIINGLNVNDLIPYTTIRILILDKENKEIGSGTGFFYHTKLDSLGIPVILTNKHVIKNAEKISLVFHVKTIGDEKQRSNEIVIISKEVLSKTLINHPIDSIDLVAIPIASIMEELKIKKGKETLFTPFTNQFIPDSITNSYMFPIEEIFMAGYPNGLWDQINNFPIIKKGVTATDPRISFNGLNQFLISMSCIPGSSGSPIFILNTGVIVRKGNVSTGTSSRLVLLGIFFKYYYRNENGIVTIANIPTNPQLISNTKLSIDVGVAISSKEILILENEIIKVTKQK